MKRSRNKNKHSASVAGKSIYEHRIIFRDEIEFDGGKRAVRRRIRHLESAKWREELDDE